MLIRSSLMWNLLDLPNQIFTSAIWVDNSLFKIVTYVLTLWVNCPACDNFRCFSRLTCLGFICKLWDFGLSKIHLSVRISGINLKDYLSPYPRFCLYAGRQSSSVLRLHHSEYYSAPMVYKLDNGSAILFLILAWFTSKCIISNKCNYHLASFHVASITFKIHGKVQWSIQTVIMIIGFKVSARERRSLQKETLFLLYHTPILLLWTAGPVSQEIYWSSSLHLD